MDGHRKPEIDDGLVETLAALSAVELAPGEGESLRADLMEIIDYVERLRKLDPGGTGIRSGPESNLPRDREDTPTQSLARGDAFRNAPDIRGPFFKAPPIIERQDL